MPSDAQSAQRARRWRLHRIRVQWVPRDVWIGVFADRVKYPVDGGRSRKIYVCVLPCLPIVVEVRDAR